MYLPFCFNIIDGDGDYYATQLYLAQKLKNTLQKYILNLEKYCLHLLFCMCNITRCIYKY